MKTFIDLFAGIGGFRVALERKGLECVFSSEIHDKTRKVYELNFKDKIVGDITTIPSHDIPPHDVLCAGFPCQSFSVTGNKKGIKEKRGNLFNEIVRIAKHHNPSVLLLENVPHLLHMNSGDDIKVIETKINEIGYNLHYSILNASQYGIPQARKRIYFVGLPQNSNLEYVPPTPTNKNIFLRDILDDNSVSEELLLKQKNLVIEKPEYPTPQNAPIKIGYIKNRMRPVSQLIYHSNGHAVTLLTKKTSMPYYRINNTIRRLSLIECKKLMGFNKNHITSPEYWGYRQTGNAVIPQMIEYVYDSIQPKKRRTLF